MKLFNHILRIYNKIFNYSYGILTQENEPNNNFLFCKNFESQISFIYFGIVHLILNKVQIIIFVKFK